MYNIAVYWWWIATREFLKNCMSISPKIAMLMSIKTNLNVHLASAIKSLTTRYVTNRMRANCHVGNDATRFKNCLLPLRPGLKRRRVSGLYDNTAAIWSIQSLKCTMSTVPYHSEWRYDTAWYGRIPYGTGWYGRYVRYRNVRYVILCTVR